ncbi:superinfection immunity protein [Chloroflexota bacterium]
MIYFVWVVSIIFGTSVFLLPTIVAVVGHKQNTTAILVLNVLGGWTIVGWVVALVWAFVAEK